jgi:hypothetical protein
MEREIAAAGLKIRPGYGQIIATVRHPPFPTSLNRVDESAVIPGNTRRFSGNRGTLPVATHEPEKLDRCNSTLTYRQWRHRDPICGTVNHEAMRTARQMSNTRTRGGSAALIQDCNRS